MAELQDFEENQINKEMIKNKLTAMERNRKSSKPKQYTM